MSMKYVHTILFNILNNVTLNNVCHSRFDATISFELNCIHAHKNKLLHGDFYNHLEHIICFYWAKLNPRMHLSLPASPPKLKWFKYIQNVFLPQMCAAQHMIRSNCAQLCKPFTILHSTSLQFCNTNIILQPVDNFAFLLYFYIQPAYNFAIHLQFLHQTILQFCNPYTIFTVSKLRPTTLVLQTSEKTRQKQFIFESVVWKMIAPIFRILVRLAVATQAGLAKSLLTMSKLVKNDDWAIYDSSFKNDGWNSTLFGTYIQFFSILYVYIFLSMHPIAMHTYVIS
jgi:hypothetical protein